MRIALVIAVAAAVVVVGSGQARSNASPWSRISGPAQPGSQLGLARGSNGVLHVIWNRGTPSTSILETRLSPAGAAAGTSTVATGFDGNGGLGLLVMPDQTLRLFAAGGLHPGSSTYGINTFTAPAGGGSWTLQNGVWGGAVASSSYVIGAALAKDGQPVTAWRGFAAKGLQPSVPGSAYEGGMTESQLATDAGSGGVVLSGVTNAGNGGVFVQQVFPSSGSRVVLPLPFALNDYSTSLTGRIGESGVFVLYTDTKAVRLYRYGGASKQLAGGAFTSAAACAGPDGRLWLAWGNKSGALVVTRSNRAVSGFEPLQRTKLAQGSDGMTFTQCEGSAGPLDLFAYVPTGGNAGFWHRHLLAQLSLGARASKGKVTISVRDAGDPVAGAAITVGSKHATTDANGQATLTLRRGSYSARAAVGGYAPATARFKVR